MINSIADESGQRNILEILQLLSEFEFVIRLINNLKGDESPVELLKGLHEQPEAIQIEFLRWVSGAQLRTIQVVEYDVSPHGHRRNLHLEK